MIPTRRPQGLMKLQILMFGPVADAAGTEGLELEIPGAMTVSQALELLVAEFPVLERLLDSTAVAVNRAYATVDSEVTDGDELALIPPVSGG